MYRYVDVQHTPFISKLELTISVAAIASRGRRARTRVRTQEELQLLRGSNASRFSRISAKDLDTQSFWCNPSAKKSASLPAP